MMKNENMTRQEYILLKTTKRKKKKKCSNKQCTQL